MKGEFAIDRSDPFFHADKAKMARTFRLTDVKATTVIFDRREDRSGARMVKTTCALVA